MQSDFNTWSLLVFGNKDNTHGPWMIAAMYINPDCLSKCK
jgi:hypothetical protein